MKTLYNVLVAAFCFAGIYGCAGECTTTIDHFASVTNTLSQPVTVEFRSHNNREKQMSITLEQDQSTETFFYTDKETWIMRIPFTDCDDSYKTAIEALIFSYATQDQYLICNSHDMTYAVLASGATCSGDYPVQHVEGW